MADALVREAGPAEFVALDDLLVDIYAGDGWIAGDHADDMRGAVMRAEHATIFVAIDGASASILGSVTVVTRAGPETRIGKQGEAEIRLLAVPPAARGGGVGAALTRACIARARDAGCTRVVLATLPTMTDAQRLYERLGFTRAPARDAPNPSGQIMWVYERGVRGEE